MKWPQDGSQQKLVMILLMVLLCLQQFQFYSLSIHMFRKRERLTPECIKFRRKWIRDVLEIDWKEVRVTLNGNEVNLPTSVIIPFRDKTTHHQTTFTVVCNAEAR